MYIVHVQCIILCIPVTTHTSCAVEPSSIAGASGTIVILRVLPAEKDTLYMAQQYRPYYTCTCIDVHKMHVRANKSDHVLYM